MKKSKKLSLVICSAVVGFGCCAFGFFVSGKSVKAEITVDYMENLQDLSYATTIYGEEVTLQYRLWIPEDYDENKKYPMITMLHGHGGQGADNTTQLNVFKPLLSKMTTMEMQNENPCIMLIPQCRSGHKWVEVSHWTGHYSIDDFEISPDLQAVVELQNKIMKDYSVDEDRQIVTGHSMGGLATWDLISRYPTRYAAALPISGAGNDLEAAKNLTTVNVWATHGALDTVVSPDVSADMVAAIQSNGGWAKYTEYPEGNHSVGTYTYKTENDVVEFFMRARRGVRSIYIPETTTVNVDDVAGADTFWFYNNSPAADSSAARDWNGKHYASFDALSVNLPSTNTTSGIINIKFPLENTDLLTSEGAIRIRVQTLVPSISNEALRFDLVGDSTSYLTAGKSVYIEENETVQALSVTGNGTGAAVNIVSGASATNTKLVNGYLIIPVSAWSTYNKVTALNIRTNSMYAKNIWNFGDIEYGTYENEKFSALATLWSAYYEDGSQNNYTVADGVDARLVKANTLTGNTESVWMKSAFESENGKTNVAQYDGIHLYVDNSEGAAKKSIQIYLFSSEISKINCKPAYGWITKNGLAYFKPDSDCVTFKNSFAYRSSFVPIGFKGEVYIPFTLNAKTENGCFEPRENAPKAFPTEIYSDFLIYCNSVDEETFFIKNLGLIADDTAFMKEAFETTTSVNLISSKDETVMVQGKNRLASQFEFWVANKSGVFFSEGNETNEEFSGGSALAVSITNLNASPFIFSVKTWNNLGDITALGGNITNGSIKFVQSDGTIEFLPMHSGYIKIPANAKGTLILPYVGAREVTASVGGKTNYALGYPVKHVFRLIFNAFDVAGDATYLIGKVAVVNGNGTYNEIKVDGKGIACLAAECEDGTYKKNRGNIEYSGVLKTYTIAHEAHNNATIQESVTTAEYGSLVTFTVNCQNSGDRVICAMLNGIDVTAQLQSVAGGYLFVAAAKENLLFSVILDSDPKDCLVTVYAGENGSTSVNGATVKENENFSVEIFADTHYRILSVKVNGEEYLSKLAGNVLTVAITENTEISITFVPVEYTITYVLNGGVNASGNIENFSAESEVFTLLPATREGYNFDGWYAGNEKIELISADLLGTLVLEAKWSKKTYVIGYRCNAAQGMISPAKISAEYGEEICYTITANEGYTIKSIKVNDEMITHENGAFSVTIIDNVTIDVEFKAVSSTVENDTDNGNSKSGCRSSIGSIAGTLILGLSATVCTALKRKKEN